MLSCEQTSLAQRRFLQQFLSVTWDTVPQQDPGPVTELFRSFSATRAEPFIPATSRDLSPGVPQARGGIWRRSALRYRCPAGAGEICQHLRMEEGQCKALWKAPKFLGSPWEEGTRCPDVTERCAVRWGISACLRLHLLRRILWAASSLQSPARQRPSSMGRHHNLKPRNPVRTWPYTTACQSGKKETVKATFAH